jgi:excisionase family DNA binding protein
MTAQLTTILLDKYGPFMDITELAALLKIKKQSMYQQIYHGRLHIPHAKLGKKYLFPTEGVANYMGEKIT